MFCSHCGKSNPEGARFCAGCGAQLALGAEPASGGGAAAAATTVAATPSGAEPAGSTRATGTAQATAPATPPWASTGAQAASAKTPAAAADNPATGQARHSGSVPATPPWARAGAQAASAKIPAAAAGNPATGQARYSGSVPAASRFLSVQPGYVASPAWATETNLLIAVLAFAALSVVAFLFLPFGGGEVEGYSFSLTGYTLAFGGEVLGSVYVGSADSLSVVWLPPIAAFCAIVLNGRRRWLIPTICGVLEVLLLVAELMAFSNGLGPRVGYFVMLAVSLGLTAAAALGTKNSPKASAGKGVPTPF